MPRRLLHKNHPPNHNPKVVLDNPTNFRNPFQFEITFECLQELEDGECRGMGRLSLLFVHLIHWLVFALLNLTFSPLFSSPCLSLAQPNRSGMEGRVRW